MVCLSRSRGPLNTIWLQKNYTWTPRVASGSKETLLPSHSIQVILCWSFLGFMIMCSISRACLLKFSLSDFWIGIAYPHEPKTTSSQAPFIVLETENFKQMESSNFTEENNKNVTRSWNFWFTGLDLPVQVKKFKIQPFSGITGHIPRSGARVAWTAWPFQVPSGKRSTWFVFKIICANQIIRFTNVTRKFAKLKSKIWVPTSLSVDT